jgi:RNA polymerase sigma-70 factor (ECF subfamily)
VRRDSEDVTDLAALDDRQLVAAVSSGDEAALVELYDRHAPWLSVRLLRRCNNSDAVAEALQDTFLGVWRTAGKWRGEGEVAAWVWGIAIRRLISLLRRTDTSRNGSVLTPVTEPVAPSAEELALLAVEYGDVGSALESLAPELRAVIQLTVLDGLTERDTARALGLPLGTAKGRIRKAKRVLAEQLVDSAQLKEGWA